MRIERRYAWAAAVAVGSLLQVASARAHAPLARSLEHAPGGGVALRMTGFGLVVQAGPDEPFAYACDALLGLSPLAQAFTWTYEQDGSLLLGTEQGLRHAAGDGCDAKPIVGTLGMLPIAVVAVSAVDGVAYAVTGETEPGIYRSQDGRNFELQSRLAVGGAVTALLTDASAADHIYVSRSTGMGTTTILDSNDGGASFSSTEHEGDLTLLHVAPDVRWALWRTPPPAEVLLLRQTENEPFEEVHQVRFFGGFAVSTDGASVWIGDEAGGVFRSGDRGETWQDLHPELAVACLSFHDDALLACTPGLTTAPALSISRDDGASFENVVALVDVDHMVECPEVEVSVVCEQAWVEWQYDAQLLMPDAGAPAVSDAGTGMNVKPTPQADADSGTQGGGAQPAARDRSSDCSVACQLGASGRGSRAPAPIVWVLLAALMVRCARVSHGAASRNQDRRARRHRAWTVRSDDALGHGRRGAARRPDRAA